jgi:hypothetical protein
MMVCLGLFYVPFFTDPWLCSGLLYYLSIYLVVVYTCTYQTYCSHGSLPVLIKPVV